MKNLAYDKEEKEVNTEAKELNYTKSWEDGIKLKSQILSSKKETEYENLLTGKIRNIEYDIKLRTKTVDEVLDKILHGSLSAIQSPNDDIRSVPRART